MASPIHTAVASDDSIHDNAAVQYAMKTLKIDFSDLRDGQRRSIDSFIQKRDTFVVLPTGYGKSLVYQAAPFIHDFRSHETDCSCADPSHVKQQGIAIVISPLVALMSNQVKKLKGRGIHAINLTTLKTSEERERLRDGKYSIVYATPESLLKSGTGLLSTQVYRNNVCGIFIDEGHCVAKWGFKHNSTVAFRKKYSRLAELRSFIKSSTPLFVLTATASSTVKNLIVTGVGLIDYNMVELSPERTNIRYSVLNVSADNMNGRFEWLEQELEKKRGDLPKVLVFCKLINNCSAIHAVLTDNPDLEEYVAIFHAVSHGNRKNEVLDEFVNEGGRIRILLATSAFGMGVDVKKLYTVVHYGPPRDVDDYFQESGRVGRDGTQSHAVLMNYKGRGKGVFHDSMKLYIKEIKECRRKMLVEHYGHKACDHVVKHNCCDICSKSCDCSECGIDVGAGWAESAILAVEHKLTISPSNVKFHREVTEDERETVNGLMMQYQQSLVAGQAKQHIYTGASIASGFPTITILRITEELHTIGCVDDLQARFSFCNTIHVAKVWNIIEQICNSEVQLLLLVSDTNTDVSSSEESDSDGIHSLQDYDSDCEERQALISSQYARVTLPLSSCSSDEDD